MRGGLRRGLWLRHPIKIAFIQHNRYKAPIGVGGKEVWAVDCAICKQQFRQSECQVDHITPAGSLRCLEDVEGFVKRLAMVEEKDLRWACKECNSALAYSDRYGVSLEEAIKRKKEIAKKKKKKGN